MSIRKKVLLVFFSIMATIAAGLVLFSQTVLLNKFNVIEKGQVESDLDKVSSSINIAVDDLEKTATDYAVWDATYQFVQDHNPDFLSENIAQDNFSNLNLYFWIIVDLQTNILFAREYSGDQLLDVSPDIIASLQDKSILDGNGEAKHGIV